MSMALMAAMAGRRRDDRGRYMDGNQGNRMDGGYDRPEGNYPRMGDEPEMRRRRDSRGRYMEEGGSRMEYDGNRGNYGRMEQGGGNTAHYWPWPEPHIPPYLDQPDMREERNIRPGRERRRSEHEGGNEMRMMPERDYPPMRDRNIVNIRDYQDRRRIGFGENRMEDDDDDEDDEKERKEKWNRHGGANYQEKYPMMEQLTEEMATAWVNKLKNTDPEHPVGAKWSRETLKPLAMKHGFNTPEKQLEFWVVMNMMHSDYAETAKKHGVSTLDFFADMAKAWMKDKDAVEHKTAAYIACCTE